MKTSVAKPLSISSRLEAHALTISAIWLSTLRNAASATHASGDFVPCNREITAPAQQVFRRGTQRVVFPFFDVACGRDAVIFRIDGTLVEKDSTSRPQKAFDQRDKSRTSVFRAQRGKDAAYVGCFTNEAQPSGTKTTDN
ncbi:MAG TPA: hypothetical protein VIT21_02230 [Chthoniobacterales bacterium]